MGYSPQSHKELDTTVELHFISGAVQCWNGFLISAFKWVYLSSSPLPLTSLLFSGICKASSDNHFAFLYFFSWAWSEPLFPVQCHEPLSIVLQALSSDQIDYIIYSQRWKSCIQSAKTRPGADCDSDHELLIAKFRLK